VCIDQVAAQWDDDTAGRHRAERGGAAQENRFC